jgi:valyl-tRNA synthetase
VISAVRGARNETGIAPGRQLSAYITDNTPITRHYLQNSLPLLSRVGRIDISKDDAAVPSGPTIRVAIPQGTLIIPLDGAIDTTAERARILGALTSISKERDALAARLANPAFIERAKPEAVEKARADLAEKSGEADRLSATLARLT